MRLFLCVTSWLNAATNIADQTNIQRNCKLRTRRLSKRNQPKAVVPQRWQNEFLDS